MDEVNRRRMELAERRERAIRRQEVLIAKDRNKKENRAIGQKRRENFKKSHKNFTASHLAKSLKADYKKTQKTKWKPENVRRRRAKKGSRRTRQRRAKRQGNKLDQINHEVLHGFNWL